MNLSALFIRRPVATILVMAAIMIFGVLGYRQLPVSDLPSVDYPTISVSASLPGASPETMASSVATPLEREFSTIAGVDSMTSSNSQGNSQITITFSLERNIDAAAQDIQSAISKASRSLPADMPTPPSFRKVNPADAPVLFLVLSSANLPLSTVTDYADNVLSQRISMISGVAQVQVYGSQKFAVRIQLDPRAMQARNISVDEVSRAISNANVNLPTGTLYGPYQAFTVEANGQLMRARDFEEVAVRWNNGSPVRLRDIGTAIDDVESNRTAAWYVNTRAIILAVQRQPGTNTIEVIDRIKDLLPAMRAQLPAALNLDILYDRSLTIRESVNEVKFTLRLTIGLVILVIFLFLRNVRATLIPSLALPLSIVGTFGIMKLLGFSLDNLSLIALTLAVGFVVDDAIVMLENIVRHVEQGEEPMQAAFKGAGEIGFTILSMTISLVAVFIPVLFMGGLIGRLFNEFAITIAVAILISGFVSLTLTPMLCSRFLRSREKTHHGRVFNATEKIFQGMLAIYRWTLRLSLRLHPLTMLIFIATLAFSVHLFRVVPKGFLPSEDTGRISGQTEGAQGISFDSMIAHQQAAAEILAKDPNVDAFMSSAGAGSSGGAGNTGRFFIRLKERPERTMHPDQVIQELRPKLSQIPGFRVFLQNPPSITFGGRSAKAQYQFTLQSPDTDELYHYAPLLEAELRNLPNLQDVSSDLQISSPQVNVDIDRDKAAQLGLSIQQIESALYSAYGSRQVSTIDTANDQYKVLMELAPKFQRDPSALAMLYVRSSKGALIPLNTVARFTKGTGPLSVNHQGQLPAVTLSFNLKPGEALGTALAEIERISRQVLPASISTSFQGTAQAFASSTAGLGLLLILAVLVIYIVLGILYESFIHPITILSGLPAAGAGALAALMVFKLQLDLYSFVGVILLVGIVKKNAIMMIDFALDAQREQNLPPREAIYQGCLIRFRPIMMTTMSALMGTLPIAIGMGGAADTRRSLGIAVVGGLVVSQLLTLYITPVFYIYMEALRRLPAKLFGKRRPDNPPPPVPAE